jgi:hypothetical protein
MGKIELRIPQNPRTSDLWRECALRCGKAQAPCIEN